MDERLEVFNTFTQSRRKDLQRIASSTNGEQELQDVINQAGVMVAERIATSLVTDLLNTEHQELLLRQLAKHFLDRSSYIRRFHTTRLDVNENDDDSCEAHFFTNKLVSGSLNPLEELIAQDEDEEPPPTEIEAELAYSLAGAYLRLLSFFELKMSKLAEHLRISKAQVRRRFDRMKVLASNQRPLPYPLPTDFLTSPVRRLTPRREAALQLTLEFSYQLEFEY